MSSNVTNDTKSGGESMVVVASRKLAAAELRRTRKAARDSRNRLLSDSSDEVPKGILKNARIPTKRSVSECVDDLSQIMADLDLNIHDLPKAAGRFCPHHHFFNEEEEEDDDEYGDDGDDDDDEDEGGSNDENSNRNSRVRNKDDFGGNLKKCDCNIRYGDNDSSERPKKSVRFDERVYETVFFASRLYDRRNFTKYHFSSRHHPPSNRQNNKSKKNRHSHSSKSVEDLVDESINGVTSLKSDKPNVSKKLSKSQRAKQSKKDKKKRLSKKDDVTDTSSDDQGYCSSFHSFSD